jgi:hypothetical protein
VPALTATITNTTISGNSSDDNGGAIYNGSYSDSGPSLILTNCTIVNSTADYGGGIYNRRSSSTTALQISNSIVALNDTTDGPKNIRGVVTSLGYNIIGDSAGASGFIATDLLDTDPLLGPLADSGGATLTHMPLPGSPAIDAGDDSVLDPPTSLATDQRGVSRPLDGDVDGTARVDIGAVEAAGPPSVALPDGGGVYVALRDSGDLVIRRQGGEEIYRDDLGSLTALVIAGSDDDDSLIVDFSNGNLIPADGLVFRGEGQSSIGDTLRLTGTSAGDVLHTFAGATQGRVDVLDTPKHLLCGCGNRR